MGARFSRCFEVSRIKILWTLIMKSWKELHDTSTPEEFREILIQDLIFTKFSLLEHKRRGRIVGACMVLALIASISICLWTINSVKSEYAAQVEMLENALKGAEYKKDKALPDILLMKQNGISQVKYRALAGAV